MKLSLKLVMNGQRSFFEIIDMEGLTELSKRKDITDFEAQNGITVTIDAG
jgi:hypothetical protein